MNTENLRRKIITRLNGSNIDQLADLVESHEGPFLRNQNGEILRDISDGIEEQEESILSDEEFQRLIKFIS
jgi:glucuronate isomerase